MLATGTPWRGYEETIDWRAVAGPEPTDKHRNDSQASVCMPPVLYGAANVAGTFETHAFGAN
eukprot:10908911-Prorocentrum_lima.AAC.1